MKTILSILVIPFTIAFPAQAEMITINVNRVCAAIVNIPYASDDFSDEEWEQFKNCLIYLQKFDGMK
jgi:hypothetical protein